MTLSGAHWTYLQTSHDKVVFFRRAIALGRLSSMNRLSRRSLVSCIGRRSRGNRNRTLVARTRDRLIMPTSTSACNDRREQRRGKNHHNSPYTHFFKRLADEAWFSLRLTQSLNFRILSPK
jgi:hypothetical protein